MKEYELTIVYRAGDESDAERMAYRLGYWTVDGQLVAEQFWVPRPGRLRHPLIGDVLELGEAEWRVTDYVLFEKSGNGHVAVEYVRR